jgi:hypothetical protein
MPSLFRAVAASAELLIKSEVKPVGRKGEVTVAAREEPAMSTAAQIPRRRERIKGGRTA